jgi:hypothetical protein
MPLFRESERASDQKATLTQFGNLFEGTSAANEVCKGISASGMEPMAYCAQFFTHVGASPKMSGSIELANHFFTVWLLMCVDRVDVRHSAAAEHVCRRILQQQTAIRRDPRSPNYDSLGPYMAHAADTTGVLRAPSFAKHVAETNKDEANILKQQRLAREENDARTGPGGKAGKNKKKKEGEEE